MPQLLLLAGLIVVFVGLVWLDSASQVRAAERHMAGREPLSPEQFGAQLFPAEQAPIATRLRELLAEETVIDLARLRPQDRPVADLRIDALDSLALSEYILASLARDLLRDPRFAAIRGAGSAGRPAPQSDRPAGLLHDGLLSSSPGAGRRGIAAGLTLTGVYGLEGPGWILPDVPERMADPRRRTALLGVARMLETESAVLDSSVHLLAVAQRPT